MLRTIWTGQTTVSFKGEYYQFEDMVISPKPVQAGGPPLWVAGNSIHALKRAVLLADGWHPNATSPENLHNNLDQVKDLILNRTFTVAVRFKLDFNQHVVSEDMLSGSNENIINQLLKYKASGMNYALINFKANSQAERERFMEQIHP